MEVVRKIQVATLNTSWHDLQLDAQRNRWPSLAILRSAVNARIIIRTNDFGTQADQGLIYQVLYEKLA